MEQQAKVSRRGALKLAAIGTGLLAGLHLTRKAARSEPNVPQSEHQWAMVIDLAQCTGCDRCTLECQAHNDVPPSIEWNQVIETGVRNGRPTFLPRPCMHCEKAPCVDVCPVGAASYRGDGIVMMDYDKCIGCRYCEVACPYFARAFNWEKFEGPNPAVPRYGEPEIERRPRGVVEKCSFCYHRIDRGLEQGLTPGIDDEATPACVVGCSVGARVFGDLNDPESEVSRLLANEPFFRLREDLGTGPRVYYLPARNREEEVSA